MGRPKIAVVKRLFAVSGNVCAFPKCTTPLVDLSSGRLNGDICHIRASRPSGPRYDENQDVSERHGFENLILMCRIHHGVIDADEDAYTVDRLLRIKSAHESTNHVRSTLSTEEAKRLVVNISDTDLQDGSVIISQGQMGGQIAHSIVNEGKPPRTVPSTAARQLIDKLACLPPQEIKVCAPMSDHEARLLATVLIGILRQGGWKIAGLHVEEYADPVSNVIVRTSNVNSPMRVLLSWLAFVGLNPEGIISERDNEIIVGGQQ